MKINSKDKSEVFFQSKWFLVLIFAVAGFLLYKIAIVSYQKYQLNKEIASLERMFRERDEKIDNLKTLTDNLKDASYLEKEARKKLNLQLPGEQTVIIIDKNNQSQIPDNLNSSVGDESFWSNPKRWWQVIMGHRT